MALDSASTLKSNILALTPTSSSSSGINAFVSVIEGFMNKIQAGSAGSVGILTFNKAAMISALGSLANAIHSAASSLIFTCIGLGPPPTSAPIPLTFTAQ